MNLNLNPNRKRSRIETRAASPGTGRPANADEAKRRRMASPEGIEWLRILRAALT